MSNPNRIYKKLRAALDRSEEYVQKLSDLGIKTGTAGKHVRNAQKAAEKIGFVAFPEEDDGGTENS